MVAKIVPAARQFNEIPARSISGGHYLNLAAQDAAIVCGVAVRVGASLVFAVTLAPEISASAGGLSAMAV